MNFSRIVATVIIVSVTSDRTESYEYLSKPGLRALRSAGDSLCAFHAAGEHLISIIRRQEKEPGVTPRSRPHESLKTCNGDTRMLVRRARKLDQIVSRHGVLRTHVPVHIKHSAARPFPENVEFHSSDEVKSRGQGFTKSRFGFVNKCPTSRRLLSRRSSSDNETFLKGRLTAARGQRN